MESQEWPASVFPYRPIVENPNREVFLMESGIPNIFSHGIQNAGLWTPEHNSRNPEATDDWNPESSSWSAESTGVEFRIQDCLGLPNMGGPLHNQEKKLWKLMKWSPKGKCFTIFHGNISQPNAFQIGLENLCVWILGLKGLALRAFLHNGLSRKCFCYRQPVPVAACSEAKGVQGDWLQ